MREKLDYMVGVYNNSVFVSKYMEFEDQEKRQKEYSMMLNQNSNISNIMKVLQKRSGDSLSKFYKS